MIKCRICKKDLTHVASVLDWVEEVKTVHRQAHFNNVLSDAFILLEEMVSDYDEATANSKDFEMKELEMAFAGLAGSATRWVNIARSILEDQRKLSNMWEEDHHDV